MYLSNVKTNLEALKKVTENLEFEIETMKSKLDEVIPKPKKYLEYPQLKNYTIHRGKYPCDLSYSVENMFVFYDMWGSQKEPSMAELSVRRDDIISEIIKYESACVPITEQNNLILEYNSKVREKVDTIMSELGVLKYYSTFEFKTSRSNKRTEIKHTAGYVGDLTRLIGVPPQPKINFEQLRSRVNAYYLSKEKEAKEKQRLLELEQKKKQQIHELALLRAKYTPSNADSTKQEILDELLSKDKYLKLAYYLEENRNDWSDGYSYAEYGIDSFTVECDDDARMVESLQKTISECDRVDGRVFRDSWPTYGDLYAMVDNALLEDLSKLKQIGE
jgi:hypothetical protein